MGETLLQLEGRILKECGVDIPGELISVIQGFVYKVENNGKVFAYKVYPEHLSFENIKTYQELTNRLAKKNNGFPATIRSLDKRRSCEFTWQIVPVDSVIKINDIPCTISDFIEGPTVYEEMDRNVGDLSAIASMMQVAVQLQAFSDNFNNLMNSKAVLLNTTNVKLQKSAKSNIMFITDICQNLSLLKTGSNVVR